MRSKRTILATLALAAALAVGLPCVSASASASASASRSIPTYFTQITGPSVAVRGWYAPFVGSFTTPGLDDIFWYANHDTDSIWTPCVGCATGPFTKRASTLQIDAGNDEYLVPIVGDFAGDGLDDILWYPQDGGRTTYLWTSHGAAGFTRRAIGISGGYSPIVLHDSTPTGKDDVIWWSPTASKPSPLFVFPDDGSGMPVTASRLQLPVDGAELVGDFDGEGHDDVIFLDQDHLYLRHTCGSCGTFASSHLRVTRTYNPAVGRFAGRSDGPEDVLWVGLTHNECGRGGCTDTDGPDVLWKGTSGGTFSSAFPTIHSVYAPTTLRRPGHDVVLFPGLATASVWSPTGTGYIEAPLGDTLDLDLIYNGGYPLVGRFTNTGYDDIFGYDYGFGDEILYAARPAQPPG